MLHRFIVTSAKAIAIILHSIVKINGLLDAGQDQTLNKLGSFANCPDNPSVPVRKKIPRHLEYFYMNVLKGNLSLFFSQNVDWLFFCHIFKKKKYLLAKVAQ